jgi:hypothetical protein
MDVSTPPKHCPPIFFSGIFAWHGQLYYPIINQFLNEASMDELLRVLFQANLLGAILCFGIFTLFCRRTGFSISYSLFTGVLSSLAMLGLLNYLQGRPEHGIPFILLIGVLIQGIKCKSILPNWVSGLQIGLVAALSPLPGAIYGVASVFASACRRPSGIDMLRIIFTKIFFAVLGWAIATALVYKQSLFDLLNNTLSASQLLENLPPFRILNVLKFWVMPQWAPGIGILYAMVFLVAAFLAWRALVAKGALFSKVILVTCALLLLNRIWVSGISFSHINYSFLCFFPAVLAWLLSQHEKITKTFPFHESMAKRLYFSALAVALFLPSLGIVRNTLLLPRMVESGVPYSQTFERVKDLKATLEPGEYIFIPNEALGRSAVVYDGPPWKMKHLSSLGGIPHLKENLGITGKYFFWPQFATVAPPEIPGFRLIENTFNTTPVKVLGIQISNHTPGHGYALYEKIP